ncbi:phage holin family protein [Amycolatopsis endophytica]|uniref:Flp pilus assembly protein TadB n=1 Tax=Amycolatopsis endophytica TaxID=860233 RepID=A0A853BBM5_9PSEU|nr:phage holin family protein [Amycolatopsis endophytica]NYI92793.1 Flp pilus assembly protein TadB [Amycolatopsis endophytica]
MSEDTGRSSTAVEERSIAQLVQDMSQQMQRLVRDELRLATEELRRKGKRAGAGAGLAGAAGVLALFGVATLIAAAVLALALVLPGWASALVIGAVVLLVAGVAALVGKKQLSQSVPPVPEEAAAGVPKDVAAVREGVRR